MSGVAKTYRYGLAIGILLFFVSGYFAYQAFSNYHELEAEKSSIKNFGDGSIRPKSMSPAEKVEKNKILCENVPVGSDLFARRFRVDRVLTDPAENEKQYVVRGTTSKYGMSYGCEIDDQGKCKAGTQFYDTRNIDDVKWYSPENLFETSSLKSSFSGWYDNPVDGDKIRGMTATEAATECFNNRGCGSVFLPSCEYGFMFMTKKKLNEITKDSPGKKSDQSSWMETAEFFKNDNFTNDACVRVKDGAAASLKGKNPEAADTEMINFLDFTNIRSLNFDPDKDPLRSVRAAYFHPKSKISKANSTGRGPGNKTRSDRVSLMTFVNAKRSQNIGKDAFMMQFASGQAERDYGQFSQAIKSGTTPCEVAKLAFPKAVKEKCLEANAEWDPFKCDARDENLRDLGSGAAAAEEVGPTKISAECEILSSKDIPGGAWEAGKAYQLNGKCLRMKTGNRCVGNFESCQGTPWKFDTLTAEN